MTVTEEITGVPAHPFAVGVIVKLTVTGIKVVLVRVPDILPEPEAAIPVTETILSRVQEYVVPETTPVSSILVIAELEQIVCEVGAATASGVGLTRTVAVIGVPVQPLAVGVTVKVTNTGAVVLLVRVPEISPVPEAAIPVTVPELSRVQSNVLPITFPVKTIGIIDVEEHVVCDAGNAVTVTSAGGTVNVA